MTKWDVFISHASEDKSTVVEPLAEALRRGGLSVWTDTRELTLGDSLRKTIDEGLAHSRFGVVVLSPSFFRKEWPQRELGAILALEIDHEKRVLPVLHDLEYRELATHAPLLADKVAVATSSGIDTVAGEILRAAGRDVPRPSQPEIALPEAQELLGQKVGGYLLGTHVGSGGSGMVFRASHPQRGGEVALKVFFPLRKGYEHLVSLFQRPKDLAIGIITEAAELLEHFRFRDAAESAQRVADNCKEIEAELADILFFVLRFAQRFDIDITSAFEAKLETNAERYPASKARGKNVKYSEL